MTRKIPIARPFVSNELIDSVADTLKSGFWTRGKICEQFERDFASYIGTNDAFAVNSGTTALRLALRVLDLPKGASIIIPDMSFIATVQAIVMEGFRPVFVDVKEDGNLDPDELERTFSGNVKAVMVVHLHGKAADVERIARFCQKRGLRLIEDASQAAGASFLGKKVGSFGDVSAFSLYATKNLAAGEGGIIAFNNPSLREKLSIYSNNGFYQGEIKAPLGDSLRMSDIHASIGLYQLKKLEELNNRRKEIAQYYTKHLKNLSKISLPSPDNNVFHHYNIVVKRGYDFSVKDAFSFFDKVGIQIKQYYPYALSSFFGRKPLRTSSFLSKNSFCIPLFPSLKDEEVKKVRDAVIDYFGGSE